MPTRILFVDDEPLLREVYQMSGVYLERQHQIETASGGEAALAMLNENRYDIIVTDLAMPEMSGIEFLTQVVQQFPQAARIIISAYTDNLKLAECLKVGHRYLSKPFQMAGLAELLDRVARYSEYVPNDDLRQVLGRAGAVPSPPGLYVQLTKALEDPNATVDDIAHLIGSDPGMTLRLLHLVNSAFFGLSQPVTTPGDALQYLGVETVKSLVVGLSLFKVAEQPAAIQQTVNELWQQSLTVAVAAKTIARAERQPAQLCNKAYLAGITHNVGKLLLHTHTPWLMEAAAAHELRSGCSLEDAERKLFGCSHADVAAYVLALWGFTPSVLDAVQHHAEPVRAGQNQFSEVTALHIARAVELPNIRLNVEYMRSIGLNEDIQYWRRIAAREELVAAE